MGRAEGLKYTSTETEAATDCRYLDYDSNPAKTLLRINKTLPLLTNPGDTAAAEAAAAAANDHRRQQPARPTVRSSALHAIANPPKWRFTTNDAL